MSRSARDFLFHIREETEYLRQASASVSREEFLVDPTLRRAYVRSLEVIGEAAKQIPSSFREQHDEVDWKGMAGMRDRLIHGYFGIDHELVWDVVTTKIPQLDEMIARLLEEDVR